MRPYAYLVGGGLACAQRTGEKRGVTCEQVRAHVFVRTHTLCLKYVRRYDWDWSHAHVLRLFKNCLGRMIKLNREDLKLYIIQQSRGFA